MPRDTFPCRGLLIQLTDYDRDDLWLGHVIHLRITNPTDTSIRFDPTMFAALLRNGSQQTYPSGDELAERALSGHKAKQELKTSVKQEAKRAELRSRRDIMAENILPGARVAKRIALGPPTTGGIAIGGRAAEDLREYKAADIPLTLFCDERRVGVISRAVK